MKKRRATFGVMVAALTLGAAGVAVGQDQIGSGAAAPIQVPNDAPVIPPAGPGNYGAAHQTSISALRAHLEASGPSYLANTDWDSARSFEIPGARLRGWTFRQPGKRCLALPDPIAEGYGVTCDTPDEIAAGRATVVIRPPADAHAPNIVGALVTGAETASIEAPLGTSAQSKRVDGVFVGTAPAGSRMVIGSHRQRVAPKVPVQVLPAPTRR